MLLTRAPLYSTPEGVFRVRLACLRHAASVDSEPGSNSRLKVHPRHHYPLLVKYPIMTLRVSLHSGRTRAEHDADDLHRPTRLPRTPTRKHSLPKGLNLDTLYLVFKDPVLSFLRFAYLRVSLRCTTRLFAASLP